METLILKANETQIDSEIIRENGYSEKFQPFLNEFFCNEFMYSRNSKTETIRDIIYNGTLNNFVKEQALIRTPSINNLPITTEAKMAMIDINLVYPNYTTIETLYNSIRQLTPQIKAKIYSFELDENNVLVLSGGAIQKIKDSHTIYAKSENQVKALKKINKVLDAVKQTYEETGFNLLAPGSVQNYFAGRLNDCEINPYSILKQVEP